MFNSKVLALELMENCFRDLEAAAVIADLLSFPGCSIENTLEVPFMGFNAKIVLSCWLFLFVYVTFSSGEVKLNLWFNQGLWFSESP